MVIGARNSLKRTCAAALAAVQHRHLSPATGLSFLVPPHHQHQQHRRQALTTPRGGVRLFSSASSPSSSSFQPAAPPGTHGTPVFSNILDVPSQIRVSAAAALRNTSPEAVFVVTGANRGIGLQFTKSLLERTQGRIVACCRRPEEADVLQQLRGLAEGRITILPLDVQDQASIEAAGAAIRNAGYDRVDALFNVAGILGDAGKTTPGPERALNQMDRAWLEQTLAVNLVGPIMLTKELLPLLQQKRQRRKTSSDDKDSNVRPPALVVNLSARVGSTSDNQLGGWYSYRASKAALNSYTRTLALELKRQNAWAVALHPGTTQTGLSAPFSGNVKENSLFPVEFTVAQLLNVLDAMEEEHSGGFYDWAGQALSF